MSAVQQGNQQASSSAWTEPPWSGWIETTGDALLILEAARRGLIPRVTRRLVDSERKMITSGSVFVFDEDESGIKRWTDGFFWSPSRILGNFLLYRETDKRGVKLEGQTLSRPKSDGSHQLGVDKNRERTLMGSLTNSYKFKPDGLMKKTFSLTIGGVSQHLISYYKIEDVENGRLRSPSSLPELASLDISPEYLDKTHFRNPPKVEIGVDGLPRYRGEADDIDTSPSLLSAPLSSGMPLLNDIRVAEGPSNPKRGGSRYQPYGPATAPKRSRRPGKPNQGYYQMPGYPMPPPPPPHPHAYPVAHYPGNGSPQQAPTTGSAPPVQYPYSGPDPSQPGQYYSYYPLPHAPYPGYPGSAWPTHAGYHPPLAAQPPQPPGSTEGESKSTSSSADLEGDTT
ncbi:Gti1/Pac2 family-domain-containing protein [Infundibulicybe gibba]|nr:Gti1/Pac2 family-domain-containing protein [Infundibulicybe gibba]